MLPLERRIEDESCYWSGQKRLGEFWLKDTHSKVEFE